MVAAHILRTILRRWMPGKTQDHRTLLFASPLMLNLLLLAVPDSRITAPIRDGNVLMADCAFLVMVVMFVLRCRLSASSNVVQSRLDDLDGLPQF